MTLINTETVKEVAAAVNQQSASSTSSAAAAPAATAQTTSTETSASVWSAEQSSTDCNNTSSTTVIISKDYRDTSWNSWTNNYTLEYGESVDMEKIMANTYGTGAVNCMTQGEINSAMAGIVENNRWMIDDINSTYEMSQVASSVEGKLKDLGIEYDADTVADLTTHIYESYAPSAEDTQEQEVENLYNLASSLSLSNDTDLTEIINAGKAAKDNFVGFDKNVKVDQIPPELIAATNFSISEAKDGEIPDPVKIFAPDIARLAHNGVGVDEQLSITEDFKANESKIYIQPDSVAEMSEDEVRQYVQDKIAQNYNITDTNEDGVVDLTSSYAGINILNALGQEVGNKDLFAGVDNTTENILDAMCQKVMNGESLDLYCPNTEMNVMYDSDNGTLADVRGLLTHEGNSGRITNIHANEDSLVPYEITNADGLPEKTLTGEDILDAYEFNNKTLSAYATSGKAGDAELALSAFEQIASNNPNMEEIAYNQYVASLNLADGETPPTLESLTTDEKLEMYMSANYADVAKANDGEILLENVQYIVAKGETPAPKAVTPLMQAVPPEEITTAPPEEITTAPPEEITTAPPEKITTAPPEEITTAPPEEITTAPPEEITTAPPEDVTTTPTPCPTEPEIDRPSEPSETQRPDKPEEPSNIPSQVPSDDLPACDDEPSEENPEDKLDVIRPEKPDEVIDETSVVVPSEQPEIGEPEIDNSGEQLETEDFSCPPEETQGNTELEGGNVTDTEGTFADEVLSEDKVEAQPDTTQTIAGGQEPTAAQVSFETQKETVTNEQPAETVVQAQEAIAHAEPATTTTDNVEATVEHVESAPVHVESAPAAQTYVETAPAAGTDAALFEELLDNE